MLISDALGQRLNDTNPQIIPPIPRARGNATSLSFLIITKLQARLKATIRPQKPPSALLEFHKSSDFTSPNTDNSTPNNTADTMSQIFKSTVSLRKITPKIIEKIGTVATAISTIATGASEIPYAKQNTFAI